MHAFVVCMTCVLCCFPAAIMPPKSSLQQATTDRASQEFHIVDFVVAERSFMQIANGLELEYSNVEPLYREYERRLVEIESRYAQLIRDAGEAEMDALSALLDPLHYGGCRPESRAQMMEWRNIAESNRDDERWDEVAAMYRGIVRLRSTARRQGDAERRLLIHRLCEQFELGDDTREHIMRALRRDLLDLIPRHRRGDFMTAADVISLVDVAMEQEGELQGLEPVVEQQVAEILEQYEMRLDVVLVRELERHRRVPDPDDRMVVRSDEPGWVDVQDDFLKRWYDRFTVSADAVGLIAHLLLANDMGERAHKWKRRYYRDICPELMESRWPCEMLKWLESHDDATDDQHTAVQQLLDEYEVRVFGLQEAAVRSGIAARRENVFLQGTNEEVLEYFDDILRIHTLANQTIRRFAGVLTTVQRVQLERIFVDAERRYVLAAMIGPRIDRDALVVLDLHNVYGRNPLRPNKKGIKR